MKILGVLLVLVLMSSSVLAANEANLPKIRLVNAQEHPASLSVEGMVVNENVLQGEISNYFAATRSKAVNFSANGMDYLVEARIGNNNYYTAIMLPEGPWFIKDNNRNLRFGYSKIRLIHADSGMPTVDVTYDGTKIFEDTYYMNEPNYVTFAPGTHEILVRHASTNAVIASFTNEYFYDRAIYTIFMLNGEVTLKKDRQLWMK